MAMKNYIYSAMAIFTDAEGLRGKLKAIGDITNKANMLLGRKTGYKIPITFGTPNDGLYYPEGIDRLKWIEKIYAKKELVYSEQERKVNIFLPTIQADLIFGGYISLFNFAKSLVDAGFSLRFVLCDQMFISEKTLREQFANDKLVGYCLQNAEVCKWMEIESYTFGYDDINIGYSWTTMYYASVVAGNTSNLPLFFIQEYESIFYENNSFRALCDETYGLPHKAIFNSKFLKKYFQQKKLGVFRDDVNSSNSIHFEHTFADLDLPDLKVMSDKTTKKLMFYARPENHAMRNLFELATYALIKAIDEEVFDDTWEFYGVGSLKPIPKIPLGKGHYLQMLPRVSFDEYKQMLMKFDIGLCPMYAPHPSVPPFEMASAGMISITTFYENRSKEDMESISSNLIACEPTVKALVESLKLAKERSGEYEKRVEGSQFEWPRKWEDSFNDEFISDFKRLIDAK